MRPGEIVDVVRGEYEGKIARINGSMGYFYHLQILTPSGKRQVNGLVTLHKSSVKPQEKIDA